LTGHRSAVDLPDGADASNELHALTSLAFDELKNASGGLREMHLAIAARAFDGVGPVGRPVQSIHDAIARGVYGAIAGCLTGVGWSTDRAMDLAGVGQDAPLSTTGRGSAAIAALNGLIGDQLERTQSRLHEAGSVRVDGEVVRLECESLRSAFPAATGRIAVFLHGLMGTEFYWARTGEPAAASSGSYGARLAADLGYTPVYLRYNSGRHISDNGRSIATLLDQLVRAWPVEVDDVALIGHSMGGLVARSACHYGSAPGYSWTGRVTHVVSLGTPHLGAPAEEAARVASAALSVLPETRALGSLLRRRSAGIRDLRYGSLVDEDWRGRDRDALRGSACREVPLLEGVAHCFVSATVTRSQRHPLGRLLGDTLVLTPSATGKGRTRRIPFSDELGHHVGSANHFELLHHPEVYERLRGWLGTAAT
jgi:pimeloyl-ACP methyl ester carboxylesterase